MNVKKDSIFRQKNRGVNERWKISWAKDSSVLRVLQDWRERSGGVAFGKLNMLDWGEFVYFWEKMASIGWKPMKIIKIHKKSENHYL